MAVVGSRREQGPLTQRGVYEVDFFDVDTPDARVKFILGLPRKFDRRNFKYRPTVGFAYVDAPRDCCADPIEEQGDPFGDDYRTCINSPSRSETQKNLKVRIKKDT
jgi:hypothetical protein